MSAVPASPDTRALRVALGCFATGVTVVTTLGEGGRPIGLTVNSFASLSLDPPLLLWSLSNRSPNRRAFRASGHFAINVLAQGQDALAKVFADPRVGDKFKGVAWHNGEVGEGVPLLDACHAHFVCETRDAIEAGDHTLFIGRVQRYEHDQGGFPLLFYRGQFGRLG